jgi:hypothetical protein
VAVFEENVADLEDYVAPPDRTIDDLMDRVVDQVIVSAALVELVTADLDDRRVAPLGERFAAVVARLVDREHAAGRLGSHVDAEDVRMAIGMLSTELARTDAPARRAVADRARALFRAAFAPR